jgi:hypothetical protein
LNKSWYSHYQRALKADGSITAWGFETNEDLSAPTDGGYTKIYSNSVAFAALKADGEMPPKPESPHAVIEPSALRATKAAEVETDLVTIGLVSPIKQTSAPTLINKISTVHLTLKKVLN